MKSKDVSKLSAEEKFARIRKLLGDDNNLKANLIEYLMSPEKTKSNGLISKVWGSVFGKSSANVPANGQWSQDTVNGKTREDEELERAIQLSKEDQRRQSFNQSFNQSINQSFSQSGGDFVETLFSRGKERVFESLIGRLHRPFSADNIAAMDQLLTVYDTLKNRNERISEIRDINQVAAVALKLSAVVQEINPGLIRDVVAYFRPILEK